MHVASAQVNSDFPHVEMVSSSCVPCCCEQIDPSSTVHALRPTKKPNSVVAVASRSDSSFRDWITQKGPTPGQESPWSVLWTYSMLLNF